MFVSPKVFELRFYECCHPCFCSKATLQVLTIIFYLIKIKQQIYFDATFPSFSLPKKRCSPIPGPNRSFTVSESHIGPEVSKIYQSN